MTLSVRCLSAALLLFPVLAADALEGECAVTGECTKVPKTPYFWPMGRGPIGSYSTSPYKGPRNLSTSLKWKWNKNANEFPHNGNGANLIDDEKNIYTHFMANIVKFSPNGDILWIYDGTAAGLVGNDIPALYEGLLYSTSFNGHVFAIRMDTGSLVWKSSICSWESKMPAYSPNCKCESLGYDIGAIGVSRGILTTKSHRPDDGACKAAGLNASTGEILWDYAADKLIWNYYPIFTEDGGSFIFQDSQGGVYRLGLDGKVIWTAGLATNEAQGQTWTDGGVQIGPNGVVYAMKALGGHDVGPGIVRAFRVSTGEFLWQSDHIPQAPNSWPVIGRMRQGDPLTVMAASGHAGTSPYPITGMTLALYYLFSFGLGPNIGRSSLLGRLYYTLDGLVWRLHYLLGDHVAMVPGLRVPPSQAEVWGLDADTGNTLWKWLPRAWNQAFFRGEFERDFRGAVSKCLPNPVANPSMDADGNLFIGVLDGFVYHLARAENGPGVVVQSKFDAGDCFSSGGVSMAPGMLVICSCENLMVFRAEAS